MDVKRIRCLQIFSQHLPIYLQQFTSYSSHKCKKIGVFTYHSPHFCFLWRRPCDYHAICCMNGKTMQCLSNPSQHVPIYSMYPSATVSQLFEPQVQKTSTFSRTAAHILVSPGDAPGAITQNVIWMESEFDAYKLSRYMCPSNYNRF